MKRIKISFYALMAVLLSACNQKAKLPDETPTRGNIKVSIDESYQLLGEAEAYTFQKIYPYAKIQVQYKSELDLIADLMNDSVRMIISNRKLTDNEIKTLEKKLIIPKTTKVAYDAIAIIINNDNPDTLILFKMLKEIFSGKINQWKQISPKSSLGDITVVFDNNKSGNVRYINERFKLQNTLPANCFAVNSNTEVIEYVKKHKNALGILSVNWISDPNDSISGAFLNMVKVAFIGEEWNEDGKGDYYRPFPGNIAEGSYPLIREVYAINRETFSGLGTGFASFIAGDQGQRIVRRAGLVPAQIPIRLIEIKN